MKVIANRPATWSQEQANAVLQELLRATLAGERAIVARDIEIEGVQAKYSVELTASEKSIETLTADLETYYRAHPPKDGKSVRLAHGLIGLRAPTNPAVVPLNGKWTWKKIEAKLKRLWKTRYFHAPKAPSVDKLKVKSELTAEQLKKCGLKLSSEESFYVELNRLESDRAAA